MTMDYRAKPCPRCSALGMRIVERYSAHVEKEKRHFMGRTLTWDCGLGLTYWKERPDLPEMTDTCGARMSRTAALAADENLMSFIVENSKATRGVIERAHMRGIEEAHAMAQIVLKRQNVKHGDGATRPTLVNPDRVQPDDEVHDTATKIQPRDDWPPPPLPGENYEAPRLIETRIEKPVVPYVWEWRVGWWLRQRWLSLQRWARG